MKYSNFVHLHTHSQYSLLDGACRLDTAIAMAKEYKMPALAITDHGNMFGAIEFYTKAQKAGIKPIIGCEAYVAGGSRLDKTPSGKYPDGGFHLILLVKNEIGYKNLMKLNTAGFLEGFYHRPRIDKELLRQHSEGLIATSACLKGEVNWHLSAGRTDEAVMIAREYQEIFGEGNFYLEIQDHGLSQELDLIPKVDAIARETSIPMVVTNDCHYLREQDADAHDALLCIQTGKMLEDTNRMKYNSTQIYFKSPKEMEATFGDFKEAMENTVAIAEECNLELELGKLKLPRFPIPRAFVDANDYLEKLCLEGVEEKYGKMTNTLKTRLDYEIGVIEQMGYAGYFLIVKDFCDYARKESIRVGPGRGSAAGSLVSYTLGITAIDPIKFDLLFERFLNPERISMPDIDIDFADRGRDKIIQYVIEKYGKDNVSQIITFGTMAARGVIRDVGRVMGIPYGEVDKIAKMIPEKIGITLKNALILSRELAELRKSDKRVAKLLDYAMTLEGLSRHCSTHAAGVVIAPTALTNYVPLFKGSKDEITTQYDMKMVEKIGLLKMDFLGLRTLTVIDDCLKMVKENHDVDIDIDNVELDDPEVYKIFATGNSVGVFQFESSGMRDYLRKLKPTNFTDITAMNALYRPGPLDSGMINIYVDCKNGSKKQVFLHPILEDILGDTYGVIVFQEQVLKIANLFAGYSLGKADLLRKAMGKKDAELMAQQKKEFIAGADKKKIDRKISEEVFNQIETFARYGFNKAHSTCYAFIAYQTAWLKNYYPKEFMAALMTSEINSSDRIYLLMEDCRRLKIEVLPPDMNESQIDFSVVNEKIKFGLKAVKNVGDAPARAIVKEREAGGKYNTLSDLVRRVDVKTINRRTLESLIAAGASDSMEGFRSQKFALVEEMLEFGHKVRLTDNSHDLFAAQGQSVERVAPALKDISEWTTAEKLRKEKEMLGFYVSGHPLDKFKNELRSLTSLNLSNLGNVPDDREVSVGGIVAVVRKNTDKKGNQMAFATIEDYSGNAELIIFSSCYEKCQDLLKIDSMVLVTGRVSTRENEAPKIIVNEIAPIEKLTEHFKCQLVIKVDENYSDTILEEVFSSLEKYKGDTPVLIAAKQNGSEVFIRSRKYNVRIDFELLNSLKDKLGESEVFLRPLNRI